MPDAPLQFTDHYAVLGVAPNASRDEIRTAWRAAARRWHPDLNNDPDAPEMMRRVNQAWEVLRDSESRARYNTAHYRVQQTIAGAEQWLRDEERLARERAEQAAREQARREREARAEAERREQKQRETTEQQEREDWECREARRRASEDRARDDGRVEDAGPASRDGEHKGGLEIIRDVVATLVLVGIVAFIVLALSYLLA